MRLVNGAEQMACEKSDWLIVAMRRTKVHGVKGPADTHLPCNAIPIQKRRGGNIQGTAGKNGKAQAGACYGQDEDYGIREIRQTKQQRQQDGDIRLPRLHILQRDNERREVQGTHSDE